MSKLQEHSETLNRPLEEINRIFFLTWAGVHAEGIPEANILLDHPSQSVDCVKTSTLLPSPELSLEELMQRIEALMTISLEDASKAHEFLNTLHRPYEFNGGQNRSTIKYAVEEYVAQGKSIAPLMVHAGDGLTDVPRFTAMVKYALAGEYGDLYLENVAEVASPTLKFEDYLEIGVPDILATVGDAYWQAPANPVATEIIRIKSGLTEEEVKELFEHIATRGARVLLRDIGKKMSDDERSKLEIPSPPGRIVVISPPGSRAEESKDENGKLASLTVKPVSQEAANLVQKFSAIWPVTIFNESIRLGPIIDIREPKPKDNHERESREIRDYRSLQNVEDATELNVEQINSIIGKIDVARYERQTRRGKIYRRHSMAGKAARGTGASATRSSVSVRRSPT